MMRRFLISLSIALAAVSAPSVAFAADEPSKDADSKDKIELPPMSPDKTVDQTGHRRRPGLRYKATVGHIDVRDDKGKTIGQVVFTAYTVPGPSHSAAGDLRLQRRPRRGLGVPQHGRDRAQARRRSEPRATARRTRRSCATIRRPGSTSPTWSSSIPSAPASRAAWSTPTRPRRTSTTPSRTSNISAGSSTTG